MHNRRFSLLFLAVRLPGDGRAVEPLGVRRPPSNAVSGTIPADLFEQSAESAAKRPKRSRPVTRFSRQSQAVPDSPHNSMSGAASVHIVSLFLRKCRRQRDTRFEPPLCVVDGGGKHAAELPDELAVQTQSSARHDLRRVLSAATVLVCTIRAWDASRVMPMR